MGMQFTAVMIQVNDSVADRHLGVVNGLGQSIGALARAIGPALGGMLWSISRNYNFIFVNFIGAASLLTISQILDCHVSPPRSEAKKQASQGGNGVGEEDTSEVIFNEVI